VDDDGGVWGVGVDLQCDTCDAWQHAECVQRGRRGADPGGAFVCGACAARKAAAVAPHGGRCGSTLIVCPSPILDQWTCEIQRHLKPDTLKVLVYRGQPQVFALPPHPTVRRTRESERECVLRGVACESTYLHLTLRPPAELLPSFSGPRPPPPTPSCARSECCGHARRLSSHPGRVRLPQPGRPTVFVENSNHPEL
jgi:hypothetical protein